MDTSDGFGAKDAIELGAIIGFAEESLREETLPEDGGDQEIEIRIDDIREDSLKALYLTNRKMFDIILKKSIEMQIKYRAAKLAQDIQNQAAAENIHEIEALKRTEELLP